MAGRALLPLSFALGLALPSGARAQTSCSAQQQFRLDWNAQPPGAQGTGAKGYTATDATGRPHTVTLSYSGAVGALNTGATVSTVETGGQGTGTASLRLGATFGGFATDIDGTTNVVVVRLQFERIIRELQFLIFDIDTSADTFRDWIKITGFTTAGTALTPRIESAGGRNNQTDPGGGTPYTTAIGAGTLNGRGFTSREVVGNAANAASTSAAGNVLVGFTEPVDRVEIRYANGHTAFNTPTSGAPGAQAVAIHDLLFCTMPALTLAKSSAPVGTTGAARLAVPGSAIDYTLTVTNTGGSPVDVNSTLIADVLPLQVTFFNGDIDPATPGVQAAVLTGPGSGLTLASANVSYSNGGTSYGYTPAAGYDPAVRAVRFQPQGQLAAYASATIRFRVRIN